MGVCAMCLATVVCVHVQKRRLGFGLVFNDHLVCFCLTLFFVFVFFLLFFEM